MGTAFAKDLFIHNPCDKVIQSKLSYIIWAIYNQTYSMPSEEKKIWGQSTNLI